jgi:hypothetical protein
MKGYLVTIDSLNTMNKGLQQDNENLTAELTETKTRAKELETSKKDLEEIVETGSILQTLGMTSQGIRIRNSGKQTEVNRARKTELIKTCTKLGENRISESGKKTVYLRIITPDGRVLTSEENESDRFEFNGVSGKYSVKRSVNYQNEEMDLCIFYTVGENNELVTGKYIVEMFEGGTKIGSATFDLK